MSAVSDIPQRGTARALLVALRPKQWLKNVLVFAAPLAAGEVLLTHVLVASIGAFVAFCLASSATYLINDCRDVASDRVHPHKRARPIAAGQLSPAVAITVAIALLVASFALAWVIRTDLLLVVVGYALATSLYSFALKNVPVLELGLLAIGFLLRAVAGGVASDLPISQWFLIVAGFGSLFMAAGKRFSELERRSAPVSLEATVDEAGPSSQQQEHQDHGRRSLDSYTPGYLRFVWATSAAITITAYCLWAFEVGEAPSSAPWAAFSIIPFVLAILRYAMVIDRGRAEAPEDAVLADRVLLSLGFAWLVLFGLAAAGV